ncbi:MAG: hypothetical protein HYY56_02375, partial [Candidatus Omnitrophica bacterium]|nr:hypothetical protein [Candidatus Omnitrophota bacterium]
QMGFERAIAELSRNPFRKELMYWGADMNENGKEDGGELQDADADGMMSEDEGDLLGMGVEIARNPSLGYKEEDRLMQIKVAPVRVKEEDVKKTGGLSRTVKFGISGMSSKGTHVKGGNVYGLKIVDVQGKLYVNDGIGGYGGNQSSVSQNLKRMIKEIAKNPDVLGDDAPDDIGNRLIDERPTGGYRGKYEIKRVLEKGYGEEKGKKYYRILEKYLTLNAWVDKNVVNPVPLSEEVYTEYPIYYYRKGKMSDVGRAPAVNAETGEKPYVKKEEIPDGFKSGVMVFRRGRGKNASGDYRFNKQMRTGSLKETLRWFDTKYMTDETTRNYHNAIYGLDELFPQYIEVVQRAPVNVNSAREELLTALLTDISGFFVIERRRFAPYAPSPEFQFRHEPYMPAINCGGGPTTVTIPRKYSGWEYSAYTYDAGGYKMNITNPAQTVEI